MGLLSTFIDCFTKTTMHYLQPECLHSYNTVLVVLPSVCLLLVSVSHVWSLSNAQMVQQINSSSFNVFCSSCLLLSVCNLARWPHVKKVLRLFTFSSSWIVNLNWWRKSGLVNKSDFLPVMKCFEQTWSPLSSYQAKPSLYLHKTKTIHLQGRSFSLGKQLKLTWQCFDWWL